MNRVHRRTLVSSVKKNSDEGPGGVSPPVLAPAPRFLETGQIISAD